MILARLILRTDSAARSIVRVTWITKIFVGGDILCFLVQGGGASMMVIAKDAGGLKSGENIILGGLILQILVFAFFVVVAGFWHRRLSALPSVVSAELAWGRYIVYLYTASVLITFRNLFRVIEYAMGQVCVCLQYGSEERANVSRMAICFQGNGRSISSTLFLCSLC